MALSAEKGDHVVWGQNVPGLGDPQLKPATDQDVLVHISPSSRLTSRLEQSGLPRSSLQSKDQGRTSSERILRGPWTWPAPGAQGRLEIRGLSQGRVV